jgi:hypothetical protein
MLKKEVACVSETSITGRVSTGDRIGDVSEFVPGQPWLVERDAMLQQTCYYTDLPDVGLTAELIWLEHPMSKSVAIVQSNYIPWKGYFDLIRSVDEFIFFDDVQFTRRDWRNRNKIKTPAGVLWLTIPVESKGHFAQPIKDTLVCNEAWTSAHWKTITNFYANALYFRQYRARIEELYRGCTHRFLSEINYRFVAGICELLDIRTKITWSMEYKVLSGKTERLVHLCKQSGATTYLSGPAAKEYIDPARFTGEDIALRFADYTDYPEYRQLFPPFRHDVSVLDLLFNEGPKAISYMKRL